MNLTDKEEQKLNDVMEELHEKTRTMVNRTSERFNIQRRHIIQTLFKNLITDTCQNLDEANKTLTVTQTLVENEYTTLN